MQPQSHEEVGALPAAFAGQVTDETGLVERLKAGDPAAAEHVVRTYGGRLLAVARRYLRREEDAQDAVQDAFLQAFRGISRFRGGAQLSTWLHRIVVNAALMRLRSQSRRPESSIEDLLPRFQTDGHHEEQFTPWVDAEAALLSESARLHVRRAIEQLPATHRDVLMLRDIDGLDTAEAAALLNVSPNAVKIRLHRARLALRTVLAPIVQGLSLG
jgi:RNA polymerase sigma-70 factor (ECF subfamily)